MKSFCLYAVVATGSLATSHEVCAQTPQESKAVDKLSDGDALSEIIVTAQRRSESLLKSPLSVTALDSTSLQSRRVEQPLDLEFVSPGIRAGQQQGVNRIFIRGIGLTSFAAGADPSVAFYVDGVYVGRPTMQTTSYFDLERVEVLRGPQGALYGRNATGGAINLITAAPRDDVDGFANLTIGNYGLFEVEAAASAPLTSAFSARIATKLVSRNGYGRDITAGHDVNDANIQSFRATLRYNPSSVIDFRLIGEYHNERDYNNYTSSFGAYPGYVLAGVAGVSGFVDGMPVRLQGISVANTQDAATTLIGKTNDREGIAVTLNGKLDLSDALSLGTITGYRKFDRQNRADVDNTTAPLGNVIYIENSDQFSQELFANYSGGKFNAVGGAVFYQESIDSVQAVPFPQLSTATRAVVFNPVGTMDIHSVAGYLQGTYALVPGLRLTAGGRYSWERRSMEGQFTFLTVVPLDVQRSWSAFTPKFSAELDITPNVLAYASATNGFKSGTFTIGQTNPAINPEKIWAYEVGIKGRFLNGRLELSGAGFYYDYTDLQVNKLIGIASVTTNAASARVKGAELSVRSRPLRNLSIDANVTYLKATFADYLSANPLYPTGLNDPGYAIVLARNPGLSPRFVGSEQDLRGYMLPGSPEMAVNGGVQYDLPLTGVSRLTARVDASYTSRVYFTEFNDPVVSQAGVTRVNAFLRLDSGKGWQVSVWGKNIFDKFVSTSKIVGIATYRYPIYGSVAPPATYGVTLSLR